MLASSENSHVSYYFISRLITNFVYFVFHAFVFCWLLFMNIFITFFRNQIILNIKPLHHCVYIIVDTL